MPDNKTSHSNSTGAVKKTSSTNKSAQNRPVQNNSAQNNSVQKNSAANKSAASKSVQSKTTAKAASNRAAQNPADAPKKRRAVREPEQDALPVQPSFLSQSLPYFLGVTAVLLAFCLFFPDASGKVGGAINALFFGLFSGASYTVPFYLIYHAIFWKSDDRANVLARKLVCSALMLMTLSALIHVFTGDGETLSPAVLWTDGIAKSGGGFFGGLIGTLMLRGFGFAGSLIILFALVFFFALAMCGITPLTVFTWVRYKIKLAVDAKREADAIGMLDTPLEVDLPRGYVAESKRREAAALQSNKAKSKAEKRLPPKSERGEKYVVSDIRRVPKQRKIDPAVLSDGFSALDSTGTQNSAGRSMSADNNFVPSALTDEETSMIDAKVFGNALSKQSAKQPERETVDASERENTVDADVFDEVMAYERAENDGGKASETAYDTSDGRTEIDVGALSDTDATDAGTLSGTSPVTETLRSEKPSLKPTPTASTQAAASQSPTGKPDDLRAIFANPEDAAMLEKIGSAGSISGEAGIAGEVNSTEILASPNDDADGENGENETEISVSRRVITELPVKKEEPKREYVFPPIELLARDEAAIADKDAVAAELKDNALKLVDTLRSFRVSTKIVDVSRGPTITRYELRPEEGTRVKAISNLVDDIALNLATTGVRIEAPIPGKSAVGIEVPNKSPATVYVRELIDTDAFRNASSKLTACLGADVAGAPIIFDIAKMPHLLIAGTTGSGKSVCMNSILVSLLYKSNPEELKLILIDPKKVEMNVYNGIPHLLIPVVSDPKKAAGALTWAVNEMERRYELIEEVGVRNIKGYNDAVKDDPEREKLPQIVIIIDELADLMLTARDEVETSICRIAQKARAAGMHLIVGTQRPSVDVITGLIKANIPSRIAFTVVSTIDSRTIIDIGGAEKLIGRGDMLYMPVSATKPLRTQGAFVSEDEVEAVVNFIRDNNSEAEYSDDVMDEIEREAEKCGNKKSGSRGGASPAKDSESGEYVIDDSYDPMFKPALEIAVDNGSASVSFIQRKLSIGYQRSARLVDKMEAMGYVAPARGQKPREVLLTRQMYMELVLKNEIE